MRKPTRSLSHLLISGAAVLAACGTLGGEKSPAPTSVRAEGSVTVSSTAEPSDPSSKNTDRTKKMTTPGDDGQPSADEKQTEAVTTMPLSPPRTTVVAQAKPKELAAGKHDGAYYAAQQPLREEPA